MHTISMDGARFGHAAIGRHLVAYAHEYVKERDWCIVYHVNGLSTTEVFRKKGDALDAVTDPGLEADDGTYTTMVRKRLGIYSDNREYINVHLCGVMDADYVRTGVWIVLDPFAAVWLRIQRPKLSNKKALHRLDKLARPADGNGYNANVEFPFKVYQWLPLLLRTLSFTCANCGRISETTLLVCERCKWARYCDRRCQKKHLAFHKCLCSVQSSTGVMMTDRANFVKGVKQMVAKFQLNVPEGHCISTKYLNTDDSEIDADALEITDEAISRLLKACTM